MSSRTILLFLFLGFLLGCGAGTGGDPGATTPPCLPVSAPIPIEGGEIKSCDGKVVVTIPEGALQNPATVRISKSDTTPPGALSAAYSINGIDSVSADTGITISFAYDPAAIDANENDLRLGTFDGQVWVPIPNSFPRLEDHKVVAVVATLNQLYGIISSQDLISDTVPPTAPTGLKANRNASGQIDLQWEPSVDVTDPFGNTGKVVRYLLARIDNLTLETVFIELPPGDPPSTSFSDVGVKEGGSYCYWVQAFDDSGNGSGFSDPPACVLT